MYRRHTQLLLYFLQNDMWLPFRLVVVNNRCHGLRARLWPRATLWLPPVPSRQTFVFHPETFHGIQKQQQLLHDDQIARIEYHGPAPEFYPWPPL